MKKSNELIERFRVRGLSKREDGNNGLFRLKLNNRIFTVIASDGAGWDHISVSSSNRCPNWPEMCTIKELFFEAEETVVQFHPRTSEYVNNHPYCLHLWRYQEREHELPPSGLVGVKGLGLMFANSENTNEKLFEALDNDPGHDQESHGGLAFSQTGYSNGCLRCEILKRIEEVEMST